ncbi:uncharacterized protein LOC135341710 [Halichondria panicea]|uniref:uncharacterized protein LOC135341710 n=1 Tax=Halichondria panicea TaxID=6063 RepID=UPI00312BB79A
MTNCYQLIILLVAAITCSTALPATFPKGIDKASEESRDWLQRGIRNIFRFSPAYGGEEAVEQNWRRILSTIKRNSWPRENQLKEQSYHAQDLIRSFLDSKPTYNISPRGTNAEEASEQLNGRNSYRTALLQALFRMKGQPDSFRISFPWPSMKSSTTTQPPPMDPTQSSTQPPTEMSMQLFNNLLKALKAEQ